MGGSSTAKKAGPRDAASKVAQQRLSVLELAREFGNVAEACRQRGMDRTSFYEWKRRFQTQGFDRLKDLPPIHRSHPQTTPPETVEKIKALALAHPAYGCNRHEAMLALEGMPASHRCYAGWTRAGRRARSAARQRGSAQAPAPASI
ncbi:hypothetical protein LNKW23_44000 [Paralimibaculum aggregatum]|uniref:Insertion element IS150 protein InsJ-like helix-turn-helix domain-containing protein n=1 Tax=Paralimibaculum aggregatum TaxID=3036245 RepID=A0ABQ6LSY4_9RHOB|nr:hypothetical protein LNKW23_44000 [Limibaculum sp. NKW23]